MASKRFSLFGLAAVLFLSVFASAAQTKNRIAVSGGDMIKLYEFNSATKKFDVVWESAETGTGVKNSSLGICSMVLKDIDKDGKNELVTVDQFGIFIWGKNGKIPLYYNLRSAAKQISWAYILPMDLDKDGSFEFLTQRIFDSRKRKIEAWKIQDNAAARFSEIELPGTSWSLRSGDCDNDKTEDILTSSSLIQVLSWEKTKGLYEKAAFPNISNMVDVVHVADVNGDGENEIVASGNGSCFTVYKARKEWEPPNYVYPVLYQSEDLGGYTQGLEVADIDGDGKNEVLVGVAPMGKEKKDHIYVFEKSGGSITPGITKLSLRQAFSMPLESSGIPGFAVGDADNDGRNEVVYNGRHVLKFSRDTEGRLQCETLATLGETKTQAVVGPFEPEGKDESNAPRIVPKNFFIDLKDGDIIESGKVYRFWVELSSPWRTAQNVRVRLESLASEIKILKGDFLVPKIEAGKIVDNKAAPFLVKPDELKKELGFELKIEISADGDYQSIQSRDRARSGKGGNIYLTAVPKFEFKSETLGMSSDEDSYKDLGISYDYFNDDSGSAWPPVEILLKYKNIFVLADYIVASPEQSEKTQEMFEAGKNLLFHGDRAIYLPPAREKQLKPFYDLAVKYFKSRYLKGYEGEKAVKGMDGDPLSGGLSFALINRERPNLPTESQNLPNILEAQPGATPFLFYPTGEVAAVRVEGKYKLVYLGFSLDDIQSAEVKKELVKRIMTWFNKR